MDGSRLDSFADIMGCRMGLLPSFYLGLPMCIGRVPKSLWNPVIDKIEKKLDSWKARYISLGGRITLIQSALANLPIYLMSLLVCPTSVVR